MSEASRTWRRRDALGLLACAIFVLLCFGFAVYLSIVISGLENEGLRAEGTVTGINHGARGSKTAVVQFKTEESVVVEARCRFQMLTRRNAVGDSVTVLYDPAHPENVIIDHGSWNWDGAVLLFLGGIFLAILGFLIWRFRGTNDNLPTDS